VLEGHIEEKTQLPGGVVVNTKKNFRQQEGPHLSVQIHSLTKKKERREKKKWKTVSACL